VNVRELGDDPDRCAHLGTPVGCFASSVSERLA